MQSCAFCFENYHDDRLASHECSGLRRLGARIDAVRKAERSCADCLEYKESGAMVMQADGRVICQSCYRALKLEATAKSQGDLFVGQGGLFS